MTHWSQVRGDNCTLVVLVVKTPDPGHLEWVLSQPRFATYVTACAGDRDAALELYGWNARVASALLLPASMAEVTIRNAVAEALTNRHGSHWPWDASLEVSLNDPSGPVFNPKNELRRTRSRCNNSPGKFVSEVKFAFWGSMFTSRHDERIWDFEFFGVLPNADQSKSVGQARGEVYQALEVIRKLRNRIAHHEPIFSRDLNAALQFMLGLIELRSTETGSWVTSFEMASSLIANKPA